MKKYWGYVGVVYSPAIDVNWKFITPTPSTFMSKLLLAAVIFILSTPAIGQLNFQQGYIVTTKGDTVRGKINNLIWDQSPVAITFSGKNGSDNYEADELNSFKSGDHTYYKAYTVRYDTSGGDGGTSSHYPTPTWEEKRLFLQVIVDGRVSLLRYKHGFRTHFFIQEENKIPEELVKHTFENTIAGRTLKSIGRQYIDQLKHRFADCPAVKIDESLKYMEESLIELFSMYNRCFPGKTEILGNEEKRRSLGITASGRYDKFRDYSGGTGVGAGLFYEVNYPKKVYRTSWYNELSIVSFGEQSGDHPRAFIGTVPVRFKVTELRLATMTRTYLFYSKSRPFVNAGIGRGRNFGSQVYVNGQKGGNKLGGHWLALLGVGASVSDHLTLELRVERTNPIIFDQFRMGNEIIVGVGSYSVNSAVLMASYKFSKKH